MRAPDPIVARFLAVVADSPLGVSARLCQACVAVLPVARAAIVLRGGVGGVELLCASDEVAARVEAVQATVGVGPGVDAITGCGPVLVADLAATGFGRWPALLGTLDSDTPRAMFAFPLQVGAIGLGVLDLYRDTPRPLSSIDIASMTVVARVVTMTLLEGPDGRDEPGDSWWGQSSDARTIHQATGMVVAQLGVSAREAYVRLQGHAFANGTLLGEVAEEVVARRLRLPSNGHRDR